MSHSEQTGIFHTGYRHFHALELQLHAGVTRGALIAALRAALVADRDAPSGDGTAGVEKSGSQYPGDDGHVLIVTAFGPGCVARLDESAPSFSAFHAIHGRDGFVMPATQHDVLFWMQGRENDVLFDAVDRIVTAFHAIADIVVDLPGFTYHDSRDLTGFVDGSANPKGKAAHTAAQIPEGQPGAGGSYVITQRWNHDLAAFRKLPVAEQEMVIGRTKADSVEFDDEHMPHTAHVARTDFKQDGEAMKIWRRSMPFGNARDHGLLFLAFSCRLGRFDVLLRRMAGDWEDGVRDRLTDFSTPVTGSYWYAPPAWQLWSWLE